MLQANVVCKNDLNVTKKKLCGHPNIVQFISAASISKEESGHGQAEFLILTELCGMLIIITFDWLIGHPECGAIPCCSVPWKAAPVSSGQLMYLELFTEGELVSVLRSRDTPLSCDQVLQVFHQVCRAVQHMHKQKPPIIHRDLKVTCILMNVHCVIS